MTDTPKTCRWRVHWRNSHTGQDGYDDVTAPTSHHAVWEVASGYLEYIAATMEFRGVEQIAATEDGPRLPTETR